MNADRRPGHDFSDLEARELTALLDMANDAVMVIDANGRIGYWNRGAERLYGWSRAEALGRSAHSLLRPISPIPMKRILEHVLREGEWRGDLTHTKHDGTAVTVSSRWGPRYSVKRKLVGTFVVNRDVTDDRNAQVARLKIRNKDRLASLGLLASSLAHEINNPLDAISGLIYLLQIENQPQRAQEHLATLKREFDRVAAVVRNTLSLTRQPTAKASWVELATLLNSAVNVYPRRIKSRAIKLQRRYSTKGRCCCMEAQLRQVMVNLVGNALDAMPNGGVLRLYLRKSVVNGRPAFRIAISDTGHGITKSTQAHLYEPLYTTKGELGTGLGLWISKNVLDHCRGILRFRTRTQGPYQGTCFFLQIPENLTGRAVSGAGRSSRRGENRPRRS